MDDYRFIDTKKFREWIKRCKCIERYEWYKCDLRRKRPNRKKQQKSETTQLFNLRSRLFNSAEITL